MKKVIPFLSGMLLLAAFVAVPAEVQVRPSINNNSVVSIEVTKKEAEARSRSRSRGFGGFSTRKRGRSGGSLFKSPSRKKPTTTPFKSNKSKQGCYPKCSSTGSKGKLDTKKLFKQGGSQKKASPTVKKSTPKLSGKKAVPAKIGSKKRPVLSSTKRNELTTKRTTSLKSPQLKKERLNRNRQMARKSLYRPRAETRRLRSERNYWRDRSQYERNRRWSSWNGHGWGYGYRPGWTYHSGWGHYGYGYTRSGLSIADYMILYALFGHSNTSRGQTVVVNNTIDYQGADVTAVPEGSRITGFGDEKTIIVPTQNGNEVVPIPANSTFTDTEEGTLITTADGVGVLIPASAEAYKAPTDYEVPPDAQEPMVYDELKAKTPWYLSLWFLGIVGVVVVAGVVVVVRVKS